MFIVKKLIYGNYQVMKYIIIFDIIIMNFEIYNYLIDNIIKHNDKLNDMPF